MRNFRHSFILLILLVFPVMVNAGGGRYWPYVPFSKVKVYLYNLEGKLHGYHSPVKDGKLDPTVVQPGKDLSPEQVQQLEKWLSQDLSLLEEGLAKCYIPHHAFIFYDDAGKQVAWMSACFMCTGIRSYSPVRRPGKVVYNTKTEAKANQQMADLRAIVTAAGLPVYDDPASYLRHHRRPIIQEPEKVMINESFIQKYYPSQFTLDSAIRHINSYDSIPKTEIKRSVKTTAGGDKYVFIDCKYGNSFFRFSGREGGIVLLTEAMIRDQEILLLKDLVVGAEAIPFLNELSYLEASVPPFVVVKDGKGKIIRLVFENEKVVTIELTDDLSR